MWFGPSTHVLAVQPFDLHLKTRVVFGEGAFSRIGELARELSFTRTLVVADRGLVDLGHVGRAVSLLEQQGVGAFPFHDFASNPDSSMVEAGRVHAADSRVDSIVALGGGSSLDCAKGINFVLTNGGTMRDYRGFGKAALPMLPMIGVPTTAGTGSEAQSYAIISDRETRAKMACGDPKAAFRAAILDPALTVSQPRWLTAVTGFDALSHAVETYVTTRRTAASDLFAREAWRLLESSFEPVLDDPANLEARAGMLVGAHLAGIAIEHSMLGATHACANPLTARYGTTHGVAIAALLPHVVRWNAYAVGNRYAELLDLIRRNSSDSPGEALAARLEALARIAGLPASLGELGVQADDLPALAADAAGQWTGTFNPRPLDASAARAIYEQALSRQP
jgi:alcohol dehydrogenase class IV